MLAYHQRLYEADVKGTRGGVTEFEADLRANANVLTLGLGNHWLTDYGLYIGGEWFMYHIVQNSSVTISNTSGNSSEYWISRTRDFGTHINQWWSAGFGVMVLTLGYDF